MCGTYVATLLLHRLLDCLTAAALLVGIELAYLQCHWMPQLLSQQRFLATLMTSEPRPLVGFTCIIKLLFIMNAENVVL